MKHKDPLTELKKLYTAEMQSAARLAAMKLPGDSASRRADPPKPELVQKRPVRDY